MLEITNADGLLGSNFDLLTMCPQLNAITVKGIAGLTDAIADHLSHCKHLRYLALQDLDGWLGERLTDRAAERLANCSMLETVRLMGCPGEWPHAERSC